ncbi:DUF4232 domain-containing protein [Streptomyces sp. PA03-1a]|nr:DUF4232 domain-containing protein [Streptomyces sp. PA03-1a]MDX2818512.1 DUF4232 domain-containing protein [Streptomyces sp. PA03-5A]
MGPRTATATAATVLLLTGLALAACGTRTGTGGPAAEVSPANARVSACTAGTTAVRFLAATVHATASQPAVARVEVTNTSGAPCTLTGATTLTARDDQDKAAPVEADNSAAGTGAVELRGGTTAVADVRYTDLNVEGTPSAREVCPVQASRVQVALPDDVARTVEVTTADGTPAVFSVCGDGVRFGAFRT